LSSIARSLIQVRPAAPESVERPIAVERRSKIRFQLDLRVRYQTLGRGYLFAGVGRVVDISSTGVLIACQHEIIPGTRVDLKIEWPCAPGERIAPLFIAVGSVVRSDGFRFAIKMSRRSLTRHRAVVAIDRS